MTSSRHIPIVFDVLGTCFSFEAAVKALESALHHELSAANANAAHLVDDWFHSSQRDFTYLSINGSYTPIAQVLKSSLPRVLLSAGLRPPSNSPTFSPTTLVPILSTLSAMDPRPSLAPASALLHASGTKSKFRLMAATNGGLDSTRGLFRRALGEEEARKWDVFSCDEVRVAKPREEVYEAVWRRLGLEGEERVGWFVAAHTWDLFAAKKAGFKTVWVSYEEKIPCEELWGTPDIIAKDLMEAAEEIIWREPRS